MKADRIVTENLRSMLRAGVFIDPMLVGTFYKGKSHSMWQQAELIAAGLYARYVHLETMKFDLVDTPFSPAVMHRCLIETIVSTAGAICHERMGHLTPLENDLEVASTRIEEWVRHKGIGALYRLYFVVAGHDLMQPLSFHKEVREADFLDGVRHYPYSSEALDSYLLIALAMGSVRLKVKKYGRVVQLTKLGEQRLSSVREALDLSGYHERRISMSYVYQFDNVQDFDTLCNIVWPDVNEVRQDYVDWFGWSGSEHILEAGCGTGALTIDSGLIAALPNGLVTATDVSEGMLRQASRKLQGVMHSCQVQFELVSVEHLPYLSETFDAAIGSFFLHLTNASATLREMARVVRKNGSVSVLQALAFDLRRPFFRDWFAPMFNLSSRAESLNDSHLPTMEQVHSWFEGVGLVDIECRYGTIQWVFDHPEAVVQHLVRGVSFFQSVLVSLPWDDQRALIMELVDRGRDACRKYSLSERTIDMPSIMIRGRRPDSLGQA